MADTRKRPGASGVWGEDDLRERTVETYNSLHEQPRRGYGVTGEWEAPPPPEVPVEAAKAESLTPAPAPAPDPFANLPYRKAHTMKPAEAIAAPKKVDRPELKLPELPNLEALPDNEKELLIAQALQKKMLSGATTNRLIDRGLALATRTEEKSILGDALEKRGNLAVQDEKDRWERVKAHILDARGVKEKNFNLQNDRAVTMHNDALGKTRDDQAYENQLYSVARDNQNAARQVEQFNVGAQNSAASDNLGRATTIALAKERQNERALAEKERGEIKKDLQENQLRSKLGEKYGNLAPGLEAAKGAMDLINTPGAKIPRLAERELLGRWGKWDLNTEEGRMYAAISNMIGLALKNQSGAAVTPEEAARFMQGAGIFLGGDEATARHGLGQLARRAQTQAGALINGFKGVSESYRNDLTPYERSIYDFARQDPSGGAPAAPSAPSVPSAKVPVGTQKVINGVPHRKVEGGWEPI